MAFYYITPNMNYNDFVSGDYNELKLINSYKVEETFNWLKTFIDFKGFIEALKLEYFVCFNGNEEIEGVFDLSDDNEQRLLKNIGIIEPPNQNYCNRIISYLTSDQNENEIMSTR